MQQEFGRRINRSQNQKTTIMNKNKKQKVIEVRGELNKTETSKTIPRINKKKRFCKRITKMEKLLVQLVKKKKMTQVTESEVNRKTLQQNQRNSQDYKRIR